MTKGNVIKFIFANFFIVILISLLVELLNFNSRKENIDYLSIQENNIEDRCRKNSEKYIFCSYPESNFDPLIRWDKHTTHSGSGTLVLSFKGNDIKRYLGIHFSLSLNLYPYLERGKLDFWIKGRENYPFIRELGIYLKEGPSMKRTAGISFPIGINENWKNISLPLNKLLVIKDDGYDLLKYKNKDFSWEIQEIIFSIEPFNSNSRIEIDVSGLKILSENEVIYDLF